MGFINLPLSGGAPAYANFAAFPAPIGSGSFGWDEATSSLFYDDPATSVWIAVTSGGGGEVNTASNQGLSGVGPFLAKNFFDLEFKNINAGSSKVTVTNNVGNKTVDIDVAEANLTLSSMGGAVSTTQGGIPTAGTAGQVLSKIDNTNYNTQWIADLTKGTNDRLAGFNGSGELYSIPDWVINTVDGLDLTQTLALGDTSSTLVLNRLTANIDPGVVTADNYYQEVRQLNVSPDDAIGSLLQMELNVNYTGKSTVGDITNLYLARTVGTGLDVSSSAQNYLINGYVSIKELHTFNQLYLNNVYSEVLATASGTDVYQSNLYTKILGTLTNVLYGVNVGMTADTGSSVSGITGFNFNPEIKSTVTNLNGLTMGGYGTSSPTNYTGISLNTGFAGTTTNMTYAALNNGMANVTFLTGISIGTDADGSNFTGININANNIALSTNFTGVQVNPTITGALTYAAGLDINMGNVTVYAGVQSSLVLQDLTFTSILAGTTANVVTIEYTGGGTAGSEVVTGAFPAFSVQIDSGVSTATQVKAALDTYTAWSSAVTTTISGVGGNAQVTVAATNLAGGIDPGQKYAANLTGDVNINGALTFSGALSIGKLSAFASQAVVSGSGQPASIHSLVSSPTVAANATITLGDTIGVSTAALIDIGANASVTTALVGIAALALPAVLTMGAGSTADLITGATFALSLDAGAGGGTADVVSLCRSVAIPNGITTVNKLRGYDFQLPFGDPGTETWGVYMAPSCYNWMAGSLKIGGTAGSTDKVSNADIALEIEGLKAFRLAQLTTVEIAALTPLRGMMVYDTTLDKAQCYDGTTWQNLF
jgi:hypothetical protein